MMSQFYIIINIKLKYGKYLYKYLVTLAQLYFQFIYFR